MDGKSSNTLALKQSLIIHGCVFVALLVHACWERFFRPTPPEPMPFTIVLPDMMAQEEEEQPKEKTVDDTVPLRTKDAVETEKKKVQPKTKPKPKTKIKPKAKKKFVRGRRIEKAEKKVDFTKFKRVTQLTAQEKAFTRQQIEQALRNGARVGTRNQIPESEMGRCVGLVRDALYAAWDEQPSYNDVGERTVHLQLRFSRTGRVVSYRVVKSSGIASYDSGVLKAAARVGHVNGLTPGFLKQFETLTVEFKVER